MAASYEQLLPEVEHAQMTIAGLAVDVSNFDPDWDLVQEHLIAAGTELEKALDLIKIETDKGH
jgi:hypothetical protein